MKYTIKELRARNNMTQEKLAELVGVSIQAVCAWEKDAGIMKLKTASKLAKVFNVSLEDFLID